MNKYWAGGQLGYPAFKYCWVERNEIGVKLWGKKTKSGKRVLLEFRLNPYAHTSNTEEKSSE